MSRSKTIKKQQHPIDAIWKLAEEIAPPPRPLRRVSKRDVKVLSQLLSAVTTENKTELCRLVDATNRLLETMGRRIKLSDGSFGLLALHEDRGGHVYVRYRVTTGNKVGTRGRLNGGLIELALYEARRKSPRHVEGTSQPNLP